VTAHKGHRPPRSMTSLSHRRGMLPADPAPTWRDAAAAATAISAAVRDVHALNERVINMLVQAASTCQSGSVPLVKRLRGILARMTPEACAWVARRAFLLVDMEFANIRWWRQVSTYPTRSRLGGSGGDAFPRAAAVQLARATLVLAWHTVRADRTAARLLLGMNQAVGDVIASLSLTQIHHIAELHFRQARPRWEDRPALWRELLQEAESPSVRRARDLNLRGLQLITGSLVIPENQSAARLHTAL
jgi:hypothetical protein